MQIDTSGKRTVVLSRAEDLPFAIHYTDSTKTYFRLSRFPDKPADYATVRKVYHTGTSEVKVYVDEIKYIISNPDRIQINDTPIPSKMPWDKPKIESIDIDLDDDELPPTPDTPTPTAPLTPYETLKTCISSNLPVYLYGPAGSGKNYSLQKVAEELSLDFYFSNSVSQEYKLTGFIDANGTYHETEFYRAFTKGGLFFLDELDASSPDVLVLLNAAIANKYFEFPNQPRVDAHPDFRVVAAGNTVGTGANEQYTGRMPIDQATLDRFVFLEWNYDFNVELTLAEGNRLLCAFIQDLRKLNLNTTFSYRAIISVTALEKTSMSLTQILTIAVLKGLSKDAINSMRAAGRPGKYWEAVREIQRAA